jgi:hypothetical protein
VNALEDITARKQSLLNRSDSERMEIARVYYQWQARSNVARQTLGIFRNPWVLAGLGIFVLKMPWRRTYRLGGWAFKTWRLLRWAQRIWL